MKQSYLLKEKIIIYPKSFPYYHSINKSDHWAWKDYTNIKSKPNNDREAMATHSSTPAWENPTDRGAGWAAGQGVAKSGTWLSDFTFTFHFHALEKEMATHSIVLA